jgi:DNA-binding transcriptional ArsR family regulator
MKDIVKVFKALADPNRFRIMLLLRRRELCVCELMFILERDKTFLFRGEVFSLPFSSESLPPFTKK